MSILDALHMTPIPGRLASRPKDRRGFPIPFTSFLDPKTDQPDFRVTDDQKWLQAANTKLCALCGQSLSYWICFIGGPKCVEHGMFFDLGMHEECARYAMAVCPYLAAPNYGHSEVNLPDGSQINHLLSNQRPERLALVKTRAYRILMPSAAEIQHGVTPLIKIAVPVSVEWFVPGDNAAEKSASTAANLQITQFSGFDTIGREHKEDGR